MIRASAATSSWPRGISSSAQLAPRAGSPAPRSPRCLTVTTGCYTAVPTCWYAMGFTDVSVGDGVGLVADPPSLVSTLSRSHSLRCSSMTDAGLGAGATPLARPLDPSAFPADGVQIYMPLFATGIHQLNSHEACHVQTSAIGDLGAEMRRRCMAAPKIVVRRNHTA